MRVFAASFFAVVALGTAVLLTPVLAALLFDPPWPRLRVIALPFQAAACAYGWAWLLYPRADAVVYGPLRGVMVALLAYLSFTAMLVVSGYRDALLLIASFVWLPLPCLALAAGAIAGEANLRNTRARAQALVSTACLVWVTCVAVVRATYARLDARTADPRASTIVTTVVSSCLLFAGGALGLAWLHPQVALTDEATDLSLRRLPGAAALILALIGWMGGRALLASVPATYRLRITLMAAILAGVAAVRFWISVAAQ